MKISSIVNLYISSVFPGGTVVKTLPANAGYTSNVCSIPESERSPGVANGNPLQHSCLKMSWTEDLRDYSLWDYKESDTNSATEHIHTYANIK